MADGESIKQLKESDTIIITVSGGVPEYFHIPEKYKDVPLVIIDYDVDGKDNGDVCMMEEEDGSISPCVVW